MKVTSRNFKDRVFKLVAKEKLNGGHLEACLAPFTGQESRFRSVNELLHKQKLTPEEYVNYFVQLERRQYFQ